VSEAILVPRIGRQRTRRVVAIELAPDGTRRSETLACGHKLEPPPVVARKYRVCPPCEERLGRVTRRMTRDPTPGEVNLVDSAVLTARTELSRMKARNVELRRQVAVLREANPFFPEVGKTIAGRTVVELNKATVTWAPAKLLEERNGDARGIKERTGRVAWTELCMKPFDSPGLHCPACGQVRPQAALGG
jgi:hypothetical protein